MAYCYQCQYIYAQVPNGANSCGCIWNVCTNCISSFPRCKNCQKYLCRSGHAFTCTTCGGITCTDHSVTCRNGERHCSSCAEAFDICEVCSKKACPSHTLNKCQVCKKNICTAHGTACSHSDCTGSYCPLHAPSNIASCTSCKKQFCMDHSETCSSCQNQYCKTHLPLHSTNTDKLIYCVDHSENGRFESPAKILPGQDGVGTFIWPNGQRINCWFHGGKLLLTQKTTIDEQVSTEIAEAKAKFAAYKLKEEELLKLKGEELKLIAANELEDKESKFKEWSAKEKENLKKLSDKLEEDKVAFAEEQKQSIKFLGMSKGPIKLNIGGTYFTTTQSNLSKFSSMLKSIVSGRYDPEKDESGAVFIDRDGTHFGHILNFMRDGALPDNLLPKEKAALKVEANFYQLTELIQALG